MKKLFKVMFVAILAIAVAAPAMADIKVNGYYRQQMQAYNTDDGSVEFDGPGAVEEKTATAIDARLRWKITNQLNDEVKIVWYLENDGEFGVRDGGPGGDRIATETKNLYLAFNIPNTMYSVQTGLQGLNPGYEGLVVADDWSVIKVRAAVSDTMDIVGFLAKPYEGDKQAADDIDLYGLEANFKLANGAKLSGDVLFLNMNDTSASASGAGDNTQLFDAGVKVDSYIIGAELSGLKVGDVGLNGFVVYSNAEEDIAAGAERTGYAASIQAKMGKGAARFIYMSGHDGAPGDSDSFMANLGGAYEFTKENMAIFLTDPYYNNLTGGRLALYAATEGGVGGEGMGLMALTAQYNTTIADYYLKTGVGYFVGAEDDANGEDELGIEIGARMGKKIAEKVDASLNVHYGILGDHFNIAGVTPDDIYKINFMLNVGF